MSTSRTCRVVTFSVGGHYFGVDALEVREIVLPQETTPVPLAVPMILGLINLRGQIVTAVDLRRILRPEAVEPKEPGVQIVVRFGGESVGLAVDEVGDVMELPLELFEPPPANLPAESQGLFRGVFRLPEGLLAMLDIEQALSCGIAEDSARRHHTDGRRRSAPCPSSTSGSHGVV